MKKVSLIILVMLASGCHNPHRGRIETFDADGKSRGYYTVEFEQEMEMEIKDGDVTVKASSLKKKESVLSGMKEMLPFLLLRD